MTEFSFLCVEVRILRRLWLFISPTMFLLYGNSFHPVFVRADRPMKVYPKGMFNWPVGLSATRETFPMIVECRAELQTCKLVKIAIGLHVKASTVAALRLG